MSGLMRTSLRPLRALHTSARLLSESGSSGSSSSKSKTSASASAPTPDLGFSDYTGRTRKLPPLPIPASSQRNVLKLRQSQPASSTQADGQSSERSRGKNGGQDRRAAGQRQGQVQGQGQGERRKRQDRSPIQASLNRVRQALAPRPSLTIEGGEHRNGAETEDFFEGSVPTTRTRPAPSAANMKAVDLGADVTPVKIPVKTVKKGSRNPTNDRRAKDKGPVVARPSQRPKVAREQITEVEDRSPEGIFGRTSLLFPVRKGAREPERSIWAEGFKPEQGKSCFPLSPWT